MSRIGNNPVQIPEGVTINIENNIVTVKGKLGELSQEFSDITIKIEDNLVRLSRSSEHKDHKAKHGLYRALISNMVDGVTTGSSVPTVTPSMEQKLALSTYDSVEVPQPPR